ncbi:glutaredoxin family protein, partial [Salmonella enterica subsp. enterica serovar Istanbul]|nr:glutaredoxin family protein [Salmonella enterica subsp. enterica serovar Istanbul]
MDRALPKTAALYRMVTAEHICPFGLKSLDLLQREGFKVEDHQLKSRAETDAFMASQHVETTPQTFI